MWERIRLVIAYPFLVVGMPFVLLAAKLGGKGVKYALADSFEQIMEGGSEIKRRRPYRPIPEATRDRRASSVAHREVEIEVLFATAEAQYPEISTF